MKRLVLGLTAAAALAVSGGTASAAVTIDTYPVYCGFTVEYQCGQCVVVSAITKCVYYAH